MSVYIVPKVQDVSLWELENANDLNDRVNNLYQEFFPESSEERTVLFLMRHGPSLYNDGFDDQGVEVREKLTSGTSLQLRLSARGEAMASRVGERLVEVLNLDENIVMGASSARRALDTASIVFQALQPHCPHLTLEERGYDGLLEMSKGIWEGQPKSQEFEEAKQNWKKSSIQEQFTIPKYGTGESYEEVGTRVLGALQEIVEAHPDQTPFVVSHHDALDALFFKTNINVAELPEDASLSKLGVDAGNCDLLVAALPKGDPIENLRILCRIRSNV